MAVSISLYSNSALHVALYTNSILLYTNGILLYTNGILQYISGILLYTNGLLVHVAVGGQMCFKVLLPHS